jgi:hypothetical protein
VKIVKGGIVRCNLYGVKTCADQWMEPLGREKLSAGIATL